MATYNFTTSGSNWSLVVDGAAKGTWPRSAGHGFLAQQYRIEPVSNAIVVSVLSNPYYSAKIKTTDTVQINGVEATGTITEKAIAVESDVTSQHSTGGGATEINVYKLKTVLTDAQIKALPTTQAAILPSAGAGKYIQLHSAFLNFKTTAGGYGNLAIQGAAGSYTSFYLGSNLSMPKFSDLLDAFAGNAKCLVLVPRTQAWGTSDEASSGAVSATETRAMLTGINPAGGNSVNLFVENCDQSGNDVGNFTGGNAANTLEVTVFYSIVDL